ncbi:MULTISPECIES: rubrerythrin-like domain-containing protein [Halorussus]|nr:rubrerythrin-like domain-containing protein [Halorussus vallis]USZ75988.1 rubrerythrin-like domain-containing protein [Halorussus vallis]
MVEPAPDSADATVYACRECGQGVENPENTSACPKCGGALRNTSVPHDD